MRPTGAALAATICLILLLPGQAQGQFRGDRGLAVSFAIVPVDFGLDVDDATVAFRYHDSAYGLVLTRAGLHASMTRGSTTSTTSGGSSLDLFDVSLSLMGELLEDRTAGLPVHVPILLHSTYRRIRREEGGTDFAAFEYTSIGLGVGLGTRQESGRISLQAHAIPGIGLATRSFGTSTGRSLLMDADAQMGIANVFSRFGLVVGYNLRWQNWRVGGPDAFGAGETGKVTYDGTSHSIRVGISW
ncbi:MAG: hypothetical protein ACI80V_001440 [Rhodothermales bacterium]|jgi:hypothetical protein